MSEAVVRNFAGFTPAQLSHLKASLSLSIPDEMLAYFVKHYKTLEHRDPFTDELQALSALSAELECLPESDCIYDLSTSDAAIAETYADVIQKRKLHNPNATYPPTLAEVAALATGELTRVGFSKPHRKTYAQCAPDALLEDHTATLTTAHGGVRLRKDPSPSAGDVLVLTAPIPSLGGEYFSPVPIKRSLRLEVNGILCSLLQCFDGVSIDLRPFSDERITPPLTVLTGNTYRGSYILCVAAADLQALLSFMKEKRLAGFAFARLTDASCFSFFRPQDGTFSIKTNFLRSLFRRKRHALRLFDEEEPLSPIDHTPISVSTCAYLDPALAEKGCETAFIEDLVCAAASTSISSSCFQSALYTALVPALTLAALGIPIGAQSLSVTLTYSSAKACLPALLGIYRVQMELSLSAHEYNLIPTATSEETSLSIFSATEAFPRGSHLSHVGATVYCLRIETDEHGLPCFSDLRRKLALLAELSEQNLLSSARVLVNETVQKGLEGMTSALTFVPEEDCGSFSEPLPLAVLIESDAMLPLPAVGRTVKKETSCEKMPPAVTAPVDSLIRSDRPELVLLATPGDEDARVLASMLSLRGARVYVYSESDEDLLPLTRTLLGAHALILCRGTYPRRDAHLGFAIETLLRAGGAILALYECDDATVLSLPDGIPVEILEALLTNS